MGKMVLLLLVCVCVCVYVFVVLLFIVGLLFSSIVFFVVYVCVYI